jgi:hypothetical protein
VEGLFEEEADDDGQRDGQEELNDNSQGPRLAVSAGLPLARKVVATGDGRREYGQPG